MFIYFLNVSVLNKTKINLYLNLESFLKLDKIINIFCQRSFKNFIGILEADYKKYIKFKI